MKRWSFTSKVSIFWDRERTKGNGALHKSGVEPVDVFPSLRKVFMWTRMFQQSKKSGLAPHLEELTIKGQQTQNDNWIFIENNYDHGQLVYRTRGYLCALTCCCQSVIYYGFHKFSGQILTTPFQFSSGAFMWPNLIKGTLFMSRAGQLNRRQYLSMTFDFNQYKDKNQSKFEKPSNTT